MQRRIFSISAVTLAAATGISALPTLAQAQARAFQSGSDYLTLDKPAPTEAPAGKVEVVEFFWYNCSHCNGFEPMFDAWAKKQAKDVSVRRVPIAFRPDFEPQQRLYYVLESLGKVDELHKKVFMAIHVEKQPLNTVDQIAAWVDKQGIPKAKFMELYNSFSVTTKARKATQLQDAYALDGVPALGINGRYFTSGTQAKTLERSLQVADYLIGQSRGKAS
ncbi:thiol:disulfide interchange protein DsbA/DsbL [Polaromonas sp. CG_9.11]|uniref:thiol:disulfide interchange protein DsbA/DsbL n=1 Tax=Polaromonas sp. CG_9.11 TaxID=2787730 RepID=UPI0018CA0A16|nr:thiol:disulfide interchange protein DsbA/DsbL [Polaromonas sp. CG_9.11]MBG6076722.1 thiol:disulfide interchange protein DsbA [Polaromonas sp. CG_9.11]